MPAVTLPDRAVIAVSGPEAERFLHNVVTCDIEGLVRDVALPGALLTPQGKILFDFMIMRGGPDRFLLDCRADIAADLVKRLTLYRLRAKAEIVQDKESVVSVCWQTDSRAASAESAVGRDIRFKGTEVTRAIGHGRPGGDVAAWSALRIAHGVAESGTDYALGDAFPHDVNLDQAGGVSFTKGCYVGQEVVSRMQHRGTARRRVLIADGEAALAPAGTGIAAGGRTIGTLGSVDGAHGLALCRIDRVKEAIDGGGAIMAGDIALTLSIPPGATFAFPDGAAEDEAS